MSRIPILILLPGLLFACAPPPAAAPAPPPAPAPAVVTAPEAQPATEDRYVAIRRATCGTLLALSDDDRAAASMFYMGYQANRARLSSVNVAMVPVITGIATDLCAETPGRTVASAFAQAYRETR